MKFTKYCESGLWRDSHFTSMEFLWGGGRENARVHVPRKKVSHTHIYFTTFLKKKIAIHKIFLKK